MAKDTATATSYIVLREIDLADLERGDGVEPDLVLAEGTRIFVTDETAFTVASGETACKRAAEKVGADGVYAACPTRSWDPDEYEVERKPVARRKRNQETLDV